MKGEFGIDFKAFSELVVSSLETIVQDHSGKWFAVTRHGRGHQRLDRARHRLRAEDVRDPDVDSRSSVYQGLSA